VHGVQRGTVQARAPALVEKKGTKNKATLAREQLVAYSLKSVGLTAEELEALTPQSCMQLVMVARMRAGYRGGALQAAKAAVLYVHPTLASNHLQIRTSMPVRAMKSSRPRLPNSSADRRSRNCALKTKY